MNTSKQPANPLLEGLTPFIPISQMPARLLHEPLAGVSWQSIAPALREQHLGLRQDHFFPTSRAVDIAVRIHAAMLSSLARREPTAPAEQKRINQLSLLNGGSEAALLPALAAPATGGIIMASTGLGKTSIVERALKVIAPEQVLLHSRSQLCGWSQCMQIAYLKFDFPPNGTRGGLLEAILAAVDRLAGTDYVARNQRLRNLDKSLVFVMKVLVMHRVGIVVPDEMQIENFEVCPWRREFVLFLLCLLNLGIPILLCGQPKAFEGIMQEPQTLRRFSTIGNFKLVRAASEDDVWWHKELVPGIMRFNLCEQVESRNEILKMSRSVAAGVPGYFAQWWEEGQRLALRRGGSAASLTLTDLARASTCEAISDVMQDARKLEIHEAGDQGAQPDGSHRCSSIQSVGPQAKLANGAQVPASTLAVQNARRAEKRAQQRAAAKAEREKKLKGNLSGDDLRIANRSMDLLAGLDEQQQDILSSDTGRHS